MADVELEVLLDRVIQTNKQLAAMLENANEPNSSFTIGNFAEVTALAVVQLTEVVVRLVRGR